MRGGDRFYLTVKTYDPYVEHHGWTPRFRIGRFCSGKHRGHEQGGHRRHARGDRRVRHDIGRAGRAGPAGDSLPRDVAYLAPPSFLVSERRGQRYALASLGLLGGAK